MAGAGGREARPRSRTTAAACRSYDAWCPSVRQRLGEREPPRRFLALEPAAAASLAHEVADLVQRHEVAHLAPHRRHPDLEPALGTAVAVAHPDHDGAAPAGDPPDPVPSTQVVDMEVEGSRLHPATSVSSRPDRLGAASTIAAVIALTAGIALLIGWYRGFSIESLELAAAVFVVILAFQIVVLVLIRGEVGPDYWLVAGAVAAAGWHAYGSAAAPAASSSADAGRAVAAGLVGLTA